MSVYKTVSSKVLIRKIFRDLKPSKDNWIDDAIEWRAYWGCTTIMSKAMCFRY